MTKKAAAVVMQSSKTSVKVPLGKDVVEEDAEFILGKPNQKNPPENEIPRKNKKTLTDNLKHNLSVLNNKNFDTFSPPLVSLNFHFHFALD